MPFDTRYGQMAVGCYSAGMITGGWIVTQPPDISSSLYDLDEGTVSVCKFDEGGSLTLQGVMEYWIKRAAPGFDTMYVTQCSARLTPGNIWAADLTIKGVIGPKLCRQTPSTSLKEMTVTVDDKTSGFNAVTPSFTREYLSGPGVSIEEPPFPPSPPGFWFYGPSKSNTPNGWVQLEATVDNIDGTPYSKIIEQYQWIHSAEPANG